jgi:23S rRNA pseudouridine2605 synthase
MKTRQPALSPETEEKPIRLQVYLAHAGIASRRACEALISAGRVAVNGAVTTELGTKVEKGDTICLDGVPVKTGQKLHYMALNKPPGYLCSAKDPQGRPLALELLPKSITERLYNVGRLDYLSSGLIFFTNDGEFALHLGHPASGIEKEYLVEASQPIPAQVTDEFLAGITVEGVVYRALRIERVGQKGLRIVLVEGKNREIRRVFSHFHLHPVVLRRVRIGPVLLGDLAEGASRPLTDGEVAGLLQVKGSPALKRTKEPVW